MRGKIKQSERREIERMTEWKKTLPGTTSIGNQSQEDLSSRELWEKELWGQNGVDEVLFDRAKSLPGS